MMKDLVRILSQRLAGIRMREYSEYRTDTVGLPLSDEQIKYRRVQTVGAVIIAISIPVSIYLYFVRDSVPKADSQEEIDRRVASRMLQEQFAASGEGGMNSLDEIKQWASGLERQARKEVSIDSRYAYVDMDGAGGKGGATSAPALPIDVDLFLKDSITDSTAPNLDRWKKYGTPTENTGVEEPASNDPNSSLERVQTSTAGPGAASEQGSATSSPTTTRQSEYVPPPRAESRDTPENPYRPRKYEPIAIERRQIDPY